mmetsp:Transcript_76315/g.111784  ORF Transcript_76315/g.111784 Transcript_76315/m.111784 type:complete len:100 (+) Transcript_76315:1-300(+)
MCLDSKKKALDSPRDQAVKDRLRDPPASEQSLQIGKGRKLTQSIASDRPIEPGDLYPVRMMRQHCFLACAGSFDSMQECGKLVLQGPVLPVPLVLQPPD